MADNTLYFIQWIQRVKERKWPIHSDSGQFIVHPLLSLTICIKKQY